jgi:hypothetical protein
VGLVGVDPFLPNELAGKRKSKLEVQEEATVGAATELDVPSDSGSVSSLSSVEGGKVVSGRDTGSTPLALIRSNWWAPIVKLSFVSKFLIWSSGPVSISGRFALLAVFLPDDGDDAAFFSSGLEGIIQSEGSWMSFFTFPMPIITSKLFGLMSGCEAHFRSSSKMDVVSPYLLRYSTRNHRRRRAWQGKKVQTVEISKETTVDGWLGGGKAKQSLRT